MKPGVIIGLAAVGAIGMGAATFVLLRGGGSHSGASTREGLVAATVDGVNNGDREALLQIMVGPASDRAAADCDEEGLRASEAHEVARAQRVDDALDEAKRRKMTLDHVGDDHAEVVVQKGNALDKHCTAKVDVVKHAMEIAMHDGKDIRYTAQLVGIEIAGRWYLATIPSPEPVGAKKPAPEPPKPVEVAVAPTPPPEPAKPPASALTCERASENMLAQNRNVLKKLIKINVEDTLGRIEDLNISRCKADGWTAEAIRCMVEGKSSLELDQCEETLLDKTQRERFEKESLQIIAVHGQPH